MRNFRSTLTKVEKIELIKTTLMAKTDAKVEDYKGNLFFSYTSEKGAPVMALLPKGKSKLESHFRYDKVEQRDLSIAKQKSTIDNSEIEKAQWQSKFDAMKADIKAGDIFYTSWGYEQTNINFYKVIERKNETVTVVELGQLKSYDRDDCGQTEPNLDVQGEPFKKRLNKYGGFNVHEFASATKWNGKKLYWSSYA